MRKINLHHFICLVFLFIMGLNPFDLSSKTFSNNNCLELESIKSDLNCDNIENLDSLKLNFDTIVKEIFNKKKEEFSKMVLHNELMKSLSSNTSGKYIFDFNFNDEIKDYFIYYIKKPNLQPNITYDYKNKNDVEQLNSEVNNWIAQDHKPDIYFVCVTVEEALLWSNGLDGKNLSLSNTIVDYLDLNLKKEENQIISDVLKRHLSDFDSFVNTFLTQHSTNPEGTFLYSWFTYNKIYKDKEELKDKSKFQNFYRLFYKKHPNSTTDFRPKIPCINSQVESYSDNLLINYFKGYFAAIKKVVDGEYVCESLDSFYVKLNPNFLVPIPQDSMREEIGLLADKFARRLEAAYVNRPSPFENYKSGKRYHYVDIDDVLQSNLSDEIFDDQLAFLKENSGFSFFIISGKSEFFMHPDLWNGFANLVKEKVNRDIVNTNGLILVTVPYRDVNIVLNEFSKQMPGVSFDPSTVDADKLGAVFPSLQYTSEVFKNAFKYCRKNVDIYKGFLCADGSRYFERKQLILDEGVGLNFNCTILLLKNIFYDKIENLRKPEKIIITYKGKLKEENVNPSFETELASYKIKVAALLHQSQITYNDPASWEEVKNNKNIVEAKMAGLIKDYLLNYAYNGSYVSFINDIALLVSNDEPPGEISDEDLSQYVDSGKILETKHTYENEFLGIFDKSVYATIDVAGLIPIAGDFADLVGVGYSAFRGHGDQFKIYMLGVAIVGGGTMYLKAGRTLYVCAKGRKYFKEGDELFEITDVLLAKRASVAEQLGISWERLDEIGENLINGLENGTYHSNQIINFRLLDDADHVDLLRSLNAEGADIFSVLRGKEYSNIELLADLTTNQQSRGLLAETLGELSEASLKQLEKDLAGESGEALKVFFRVNPEGVRAWEKLMTSATIRTSTPALETVSKWLDDGIEITFKANGADAATIITNNGHEVGEFVKDGANEFLVISDDFFVSSGTPKSFGSLTVNANTGEVLSNVGYVKNADGTIGFVEDVSAYGNSTIQNTIKQRGDLRGALSGIKATEDAHHIIPIQLLKENDVVKKAVEGGFSFNTSHNGLAIEKFKKSTGAGRHGPHPQYTSQIRQALDDWAAITPNYSSQQAKEFLDIIIADIKNTITTSSGKINNLNLAL